MSKVSLVGLVGLGLAQLAGCPVMFDQTALPAARVRSSLGEFLIQLDPDHAPLSVLNFAQYVEDGFYRGTIFHRVIAGFVVQGGGYTPELVEKPTRPAIPNESDNGLLNRRGTVAMARRTDPDSATAQFFINLADNPELDATPDQHGYAVFGHVVAGMDVVDRIAQSPTEQRAGFEHLPVPAVVIEDVELVDLPGGLELTPEGQAFLADRAYRAALLVRELLADLVRLAIARP